MMAAPPQQIRDNLVRCPNCSVDIPVRRQNPRGEGAAYVDEWKAVTTQIMNIMQCWLSHSDLHDVPHTKVSLRETLATHGLTLSENACSARVSEMLGLGVIRLAGVERRETPHRTITSPRYRLNTDYVTRLINRGGRLK